MWNVIGLLFVLLAPQANSAGESARLVVRVQADHVAATVTIDGRAHGSTPVTVGVEPGEHTVKLEWSGRHTEAAVVVEAGDERTVELTTEAIGAQGTIVVAAAGAAVRVDGVPVGIAPISVSVCPGEHRVEVAWPSGHTAHRVFDVRAGDRLELRE